MAQAPSQNNLNALGARASNPFDQADNNQITEYSNQGSNALAGKYPPSMANDRKHEQARETQANDSGTQSRQIPKVRSLSQYR